MYGRCYLWDLMVHFPHRSGDSYGCPICYFRIKPKSSQTEKNQKRQIHSTFEISQTKTQTDTDALLSINQSMILHVNWVDNFQVWLKVWWWSYV